MKKLVPAFLAACAALSLTACSSDAGASSDEPAVVIEVKNMAYTPASVTIEKGQTVEWKFDDSGLPHDVVGNGYTDGKLQTALTTKRTVQHHSDDHEPYP